MYIGLRLLYSLNYRYGFALRHSALVCTPVDHRIIYRKRSTRYLVYAFLVVFARSLNPPLEDSPIFQLQVTFAALQEGCRKVFNPTKLVESLQLRTSEQQDAQE